MSKQKQIGVLFLLASIAFAALSCSVASDKEAFFGKTTPPEQNILRYVSGDEPESLDPAISNGQPEARIYMALYDGLVEYHPKTMEPEPGLAECWEGNNDSSEFRFYLRRNGRWSNGDPINAHDFVYSFRRALAKETASRNAYLAYYIKYAQAFNGQQVFVRDPTTGQFLLAKDFDESTPPEPIAGSALDAGTPEYPADDNAQAEPDSDFHKQLHTPLRRRSPLMKKGAPQPSRQTKN
jgi:oligopeptide transport system substrate-binding protein